MIEGNEGKSNVAIW